MREFSTVELTQEIGTVTHIAAKEPVAITHHRKPRFVLMSVEDYQRLKSLGDPRKVGRTASMPADLAAEVSRAVAGIEAEGDQK